MLRLQAVLHCGSVGKEPKKVCLAGAGACTGRRGRSARSHTLVTHRKKLRARRFSKRPISADCSASKSLAGTLWILPLDST